MRCYYTKFIREIHFDRTRYQQFLREQGLNGHDIMHLNILFITDFTLSHLRGSPTLAEGGFFFQRDREYIAKLNKDVRGLYRPCSASRACATIFLRPQRYEAPVHQMDPIFLDEPLLHETRHHIQYCLKLPCSEKINEVLIGGDPISKRNQPWEIDAEDFTRKHIGQVSFFLPVSRPLKRGDL